MKCDFYKCTQDSVSDIPVHAEVSRLSTTVKVCKDHKAALMNGDPIMLAFRVQAR